VSGTGVPNANPAFGVDLLNTCADDFVTGSQFSPD
jgi:hypothetical protein